MARPDKFVVTGTGTFPIDMLRYDRCFPASESDSHVIDVTRTPGYRGDARKTVTLQMADPKRQPTEARWESFGWTVVDG